MHTRICINAGVRQAWMDGAKDLAGNARRVGPRPDIGCYEALPAIGFTLVVR